MPGRITQNNGEKTSWLSGLELMNAIFPTPEMIISPWLPTSGIVMLIGERGVGKTYISLSIAMSVISGQPHLDFLTPKPRKVLYVDGEMNIASFQKRFKKLIKGMKVPEQSLGNFRYMSYALSDIGIPCIADAEDSRGRKMINEASKGCDLIILDNLSALIRTGSADKSEIWNAVLPWLLRFRTQGQTVLLIDHKSNKKGAKGARGTSRKEDVLDTAIELSVKDKQPINWMFTKARDFDPGDPFYYRMWDMDDNTAIRPERCGVSQTENDVGQLYRDGLSYREISEKLDISKTTVGRIIKKRTQPTPPL